MSELLDLLIVGNCIMVDLLRMNPYTPGVDDMDKVLFEAAKATQALLVARENAKTSMKRLIPDVD